MIRLVGNNLVETSYEVSQEAKNASLFGIGNGYFGIRGSFEEFGDVIVQGSYVRGLFDQIIENPLAKSENLYMKRYYFDEEKLKEFEYEDSCINIGDLTALRVKVGDLVLRPWTAKIVSWRRYLDYKKGSLVRKVVYDDGKGNQTELRYEKLCSFADNHLFTQSLAVKKLNHDLDVKIESGIDTMVKTGGEHKATVTFSSLGGESELRLSFGEKYHAEGDLRFKDETSGLSLLSQKEEKGFYHSSYRLEGREGEVRKNVLFYCSADPEWENSLYKEAIIPSADEIVSASLKAYKPLFKRIDIRLKANKEADAYIRFASFQTLIGFDRHDSVHSLSAKNLTAEKYNQFVWWDCEIYQLPFFLTSFPDKAKSIIDYRLKRIGAAREIAAKEGYRGAKFAFCSSVKGDENVWSYAKHPFLQIHISGDVGVGLINYYLATKDKKTMLEGGFAELLEIIDYLKSRSTLMGDDKYHFLNVTGTDEHHPNVNDDAYTCYETSYLIDETLALARECAFELGPNSLDSIRDFREKLFLPSAVDGLIPQFEGYFSLKKSLPVDGDSNPGFQMKRSGLYNLSQVIKQPDVLVLYSYLGIDIPGDYYKNYRYYKKMCEASSSLTYPTHALSAIDNLDFKSFHQDFLDSVKMDFLDLYGGAYQGLHAGALAGGRYVLLRGLLGFRNGLDYLEVKPHFDPFFGEFEFEYVYQGALIEGTLRKNGLELRSSADVELKTEKMLFLLKAGERISLPLSCNKRRLS